LICFLGTEKLHLYNCTNFCLQLHKIFYNCTICAQLHTKKTLTFPLRDALLPDPALYLDLAEGSAPDPVLGSHSMVPPLAIPGSAPGTHGLPSRGRCAADREISKISSPSSSHKISREQSPLAMAAIMGSAGSADPPLWGEGVCCTILTPTFCRNHCE